MLLLVALVFGPLPSAQADEADYPEIAGTVTAEGVPAEEISVVAYDDQGESVARRWTDSDGRYELAVPPGGSYRLSFIDEERQTYRGEYWNDQPTLAAATPISVGTSDVTGKNADLIRNPTIRGTVTNEGLDEIEGAYVDVYRLVGGTYQQVGHFNSGVDGRYQAPVEAGGTYKLKFGGRGYEDEWFDGAATEAAATAIPVTTTLTGRDVTLTALPAVTGVVSGPSGPLMYVRVKAHQKKFYGSYSYWQEVDSTLTRQDGTYALPLEPGEYHIEFEHGSFVDEYYADSATLEGSTPVMLGAEDQAVDATLAAPETIHGTIRSDSDNTALPGVTVKAERRMDGPVGPYWQPLPEVTSGPDGAYAVPAVPGTYLLRFDGGAAYRSEFHADATERDLATTVTVGAEGMTVDASLSRHPTVSGVVTRSGGIGLAGIEVSLLAEVANGSGTRWKSVASGSTSADGSYAVAAPAGDYRLRFRDTNGVYRSEYFADSPTSGGAALLELTADGLEGRDAELVAQAAISGTVSGPAGAAPGVTVTAYETYIDDDNLEMVRVAASTTTSSSGAYSLALEDGAYRLRFSTADLSLRPEFWDDASSYGDAEDIVVDGSPIVGKDAELEVGSGVIGTVSAPEGHGPIWVHVYARDADGGWRFFDEAQPTNGVFDVSLPAGTYRVKYEAGMFDPIYSGGSTTFGGATDIVITPGVVHYLDDVTFGAGAAVTNVVAPSVTGTPAVGSTLLADDGTWGPGTVALSRQWLRDGEPIQGATTSSYVVGPNDLGARISLKVKGTRTGLLSRSKTSVPTAPIGQAPPVVGPPAPVAKKAASISISVKGAKKKATLTITVKASGLKPTGKVTIKLGNKKLKTVTLKNGKAKVTLTKQKKGKRAYKVVYSGDSRVNAKTVTSKKVTIK